VSGDIETPADLSLMGRHHRSMQIRRHGRAIPSAPAQIVFGP